MSTGALERLKMKQHKEIQHILEYERIVRHKEQENNLRLKNKKQKFLEIERKRQQALKEVELKKKLHELNLMQTQEQEKKIFEERSKAYQQKVTRTLNVMNDYEKSKKPKFLTELKNKSATHQKHLESVRKARELMEELKIKEMSKSLEIKFKTSDNALRKKSREMSERQKQERMKNESYLRLVERSQMEQESFRQRKGEQFDAKLDKVDQILKKKELTLKEKNQLRIQQELYKQQQKEEFEKELASLKNKQNQYK